MSDFALEPFVRATRTTFARLVGLEVTAAEADHGTGVVTGYDVSGIVGLSRIGDERRPNCGSLVLSFSAEVARRVVGRILGADEMPELGQDVADGVGELVNIIAGQAKQGLADVGIAECRTTLPNVILGSQHRVFYQRNVERTAVQFSSELGDFLLQRLLMFPIDERPMTEIVAVKRRQ